jgi:hypothetical protein
VLGFALHHGPTQGGAAEGHKFQDWYAATQQSYEAAFGSAPPADIWPPAAVRFGEAPHFRRVNMRGKWLLPKPRLPRWQWPRLATGQLAGLALAALLVLAGCTARTPLNPFNWYGTEFLLLFWVLGATLLPLACWARYRGRGPLEDYPGELPSTYALARLAQRGRLVADSALDEELLATGLLLPAPERRRLNRLPLAAAVALGLFGLVKVLVGLSRGRPVEFLIISLVVLAFATSLAMHFGAWATGRGATVLRGIEERLARQRGRADGPNVVIMAVAVLGVSSLHSLGLGQLATSLAPTTDGSSGDSGGSGCGGGGCGGGGCGGCGS